jgi:hypothetical protein
MQTCGVYMARESHTEMPDEPPYATLVGPEGDETLLLAKDENWLSGGSGDLGDKIYLACEQGHVDLSECR